MLTVVSVAGAAGVLVIDGEDGVLNPTVEDAGVLEELGDLGLLEPVEDGVDAALVGCVSADGRLDFESVDDAAVSSAAFTLGCWLDGPEVGVCAVLESLFGALSLLEGESGCEAFAGPVAVELLLLEDDEVSEPPEALPSSAWATPAPLARAAPTPRVMAPAPNHVWGSMR